MDSKMRFLFFIKLLTSIKCNAFQRSVQDYRPIPSLFFSVSLSHFPVPSLPTLPRREIVFLPRPAVWSLTLNLPVARFIIQSPINCTSNPCHRDIHHITATATGDLVQQVGRPAVTLMSQAGRSGSEAATISPLTHLASRRALSGC